MPIRFAAALGAGWLAAACLAGPAPAHEGHDHAAAPPLPATVAPRGEAVSEAFELVAVAHGGALILHLDRFSTNAPVLDARIEIETPEGSRWAAPAGEGTYRLPAPWLDRPGRHDILATVSAGETVDVLSLGVTVPSAAPALSGARPSAPDGVAGRLAGRDPALVATASGAFVLGMLAMLALRARRAGPALALLALGLTLAFVTRAQAQDGRADAPDRGAALLDAAPPPADSARRLPDGSLFVPKPTQRLLVLRTVLTAPATVRRRLELPGRIIPDPNASGVVQSSVGGRLSPPASGAFPHLGARVRRGEVLATVTPPIQAVDVSDMRQRQGELDQQIAIVERRVERYGRLAVTGAVARTQLDDAEAELAGLRDRRGALDRIRREPEALVAPVDGVIAQAAAVAGQMAVPGTLVFQIVDPDRLFVEALSFDAPGPAEEASARLPDGRSLDLAYRGAGLADRNQAVPVQFAILGGAGGLRLGQFVTVQAAAEGTRRGLALPRASVVRGAGGDVVYEHVGPERFVARAVRVEPLDAGRVLVSGGIGPGRRIVTEGAELLDQVR
ncbi:efflux RND transporter periplasmic adaptor subunit [Methylobacterium planeticum]|uniref:HlyD family efflux transporter periplasmic adaptor subunit n=1 Tax=Methylobacterium planeticum TaxID=2615211 RepID=A0A6N6MQQ7_9HYPH|nr:HlyD family efflux transporter periplasmic adaptor subunit [Methylobacterium planeticum]KAB1071611.1 HlyD family efflux transporter periplasmic adaptor subunit [Methylobacterium planeticum]